MKKITLTQVWRIVLAMMVEVFFDMWNISPLWGILSDVIPSCLNEESPHEIMLEVVFGFFISAFFSLLCALCGINLVLFMALKYLVMAFKDPLIRIAVNDSKGLLSASNVLPSLPR